MRLTSPAALLAAAALASCPVAAPAQTPHYLATYTFDNPAALGQDATGNGKTATMTGTPTYAAAGQHGGAVALDGLSYLRAPVDVNPTTLPAMSWGAWVRPTTATAIQAILSHDNGGFDRDLDIDNRSGVGAGATAYAAFRGSPGVQNSGVAPTANGWTFVAAVYDQSANSMTLYVGNGSGQQSFTTTTAFGPGNAFFDIGHNPGGGENFTGLVDDVFVSDQALSAAQISDIRVNGLTPVPEPGTVLAVGAAGLVAFGLWRRRSRPRLAIPVA